MTTTTNTTEFARHYLEATNWLLEAIAAPSQGIFTEAYAEAILADNTAYGIAEHTLAAGLMAQISTSARQNGYHAGCC